jgi:hypothetical protein
MSNFGKRMRSSGGLYVPTTVGEAYGGGFYVGRLSVTEGKYALIVAPKATGETSALRYATTAANQTGTTSRWNGLANRQEVVSTINNYPAQLFCYNLRIGGFDDWHLPAQDEMELLYRYLKPSTGNNGTSWGANPSVDPVTGNYTASDPQQTTATNFRTGAAEPFEISAYYLASAAGPSGGSIGVTTFVNGSIGASGSNTTDRLTRAVRLVKI